MKLIKIYNYEFFPPFNIIISIIFLFLGFFAGGGKMKKKAFVQIKIFF